MPRLRREAIDHVGEEHRQRPLSVAHGQVAKGRRVVGFHQLGPHHGQDVEHLAQPPAAPLRHHVVLDAVREDHDAHVVVVVVRREGEPQGRPHHVLHAGLTSEVGREQTPGVQHEQYLLTPFLLVLPGDHLAAASGRLPVDVTGVVARYPLPQTLELPSLAGPAQVREAALSAAHRLGHRCLEPRCRETRVHGDGPGMLDATLPRRDSQWTTTAHGQPAAGFPTATLRGHRQSIPPHPPGRHRHAAAWQYSPDEPRSRLPHGETRYPSGGVVPPVRALACPADGEAVRGDPLHPQAHR